MPDPYARSDGEPMQGATMTVRAHWRGVQLAASDRTVLVEGNHYFPLEDVAMEHLVASEHSTFCSWKGDARYYDVVAGAERNVNAAWYYAEPYDAAAQIKGHVAFWHGVEVTGSTDRTSEIHRHAAT
jgi:uncharacterized protein (DUF427 family)